jgi:hypothetical protein
MKVAPVLLGGLFAALLGCAGGTASTSNASRPDAPSSEPLVNEFRLACDARNWRVAFVLGAPTRVSGKVQLRSDSRWRVTRAIQPQRLEKGRHVVELGRLARTRSYRLRFLFWRSPGRHLTVSREFRATCDGRFATPLPLPDHPEPSLPVGSGGQPSEGSGESSTGSTEAGTTAPGP